MKCTNGHDCGAGQKFCAECGAAVQAELMKASCSGCNTEHDGTFKFCPGCGTSMIKADADLGAVLGELTAFAKSRETLSDVIEVQPGDHPAVPQVPAGDDDVTPFLKAIVEGHNRTIDHLNSIAGEVRADRKEDAGFIKALVGSFTALGGMVKALEAKVDSLLNAPAGPRSALVTPFSKATPGAQPAAAAQPEAIGANAALKKELIKAAVIASGAGKLPEGDGTLTQYYVNRLSNAEPPLAQLLKSSIPEARALGGRLQSAIPSAAGH